MNHSTGDERIIQVIGSPSRQIRVIVAEHGVNIYSLCATIAAAILPNVPYNGKSIDAFVDLMFDQILNGEFRLTIVLLQGQVNNSALQEDLATEMRSVFQQIADDLEPYPERQILVAWN